MSKYIKKNINHIATKTYFRNVKSVRKCKVNICISNYISGRTYLRKRMNRIQKAYNGNINGNSIKILSWNKSGFNILNKMNEIKEIITTHKPHILYVN